MSDNSYQLDSQNIQDNTENIGQFKTSLPQVPHVLGIHTAPSYSLSTLADPIAFKIESLLIDFGTLTATNPVIRTVNFTINKGIGGYEMLAAEDHQLLAGNAASIPDTSCDNGSCTIDTAAPWSNTLTFGFGYRCNNIAGSDCDRTFETEENYKRLPNSAKGQGDTVVAASSTIGENAQAQIVYKLNIAGNQSPGPYNNTITYIAVPNF